MVRLAPGSALDHARVSARRASPTCKGNTLYDPGWHFGFNWPAFVIVMLLTVVLVRGIRESARTNNVMVLMKIAAILIFIGFAARFIHPANWHPFAPNGWPGILTGGSIIFFTYIGFDSVSTAAEECKNPQRDLPIGIIATLVICTVLYIGVVVVLTGIVPWQTLVDDAAPVVNTMKRLHFGNIRLVVLIGALMGMISSLLVFQLGQARVWFAMSRDGLLPRHFQPRPPALSHAGFFHVGRGIRRRHSRRVARHWHARGPLEYRNSLCLRAGCRRRADSALSPAEPPAAFPRARRLARANHDNPFVRVADDGPHGDELDSFFRVAGDRAVCLLLLQPQTQPAFERESGSGCQGSTSLMRRSASRWMTVGLRATPALLLAILFLSLPSSFGWGENAERMIVDKAVDTLPDEMQPFFQANRSFLIQHVTDPLEAEARTPAAQAKDFIQLDHYGPFPFTELPRTYTAAVTKYGRRSLDAHGVLPWQIGLYSKKLTDAFSRSQLGRREAFRCFARSLRRRSARSVQNHC